MGDENKLLKPIDGVPTVERVVGAAIDLGFEKIVVVTGHDGDAVAAAIGPYRVDVVHNPEYRLGMGSSLVAGVRAAGMVDGYLIWPADMPWVAYETVTKICATCGLNAIALPTRAGRRGHPVLFSARFRDALLDLEASAGARSVLGDNATYVVEVSVDDPGIHADLDEPQDFLHATAKLEKTP
jgi:molybdenum cofactor cytidylyltransferase